MGHYLRITASLLLLLQGLHMAFLHDTTDSPGQTIVKAHHKHDEDADQNGIESSDDQDTGIPAGSTFNSSGEYDDSQDQDAHRTDVTIVTTMLPGLSTDSAENAEFTVTTAAHSTILLNASQTTDVATESHNSTTALPDITTHQGSNGSMSNDTDLIETTTATEINATEAVTPQINLDNSVTNNSTEDNVNATTTEEPELVPSTANMTTKLSSGTTPVVFPETTTMTPGTTEAINSTNTGTASGSNSERGFASDVRENKRSEAWGAILGTAVAVAFVGLVVYVILKRRGQRDFTHRKLVEEFPSDPVLRLDNSEPLDLKYDGSAYYNPGLQMDNIQMTNFPQGSGN